MYRVVIAYSNSNSSYSAPMPQRQPSTITNCDGAGCWGSDGTRYNRGAGDTYFPFYWWSMPKCWWTNAV